MPLHGHTKIELTDLHTGRTRVVEQDNLVTNAMQEIMTPFGMYTLGANLLDDTSQENFADLISQFYGGLLLFDRKIGGDATTLFAPAEAKVVGCAGYNGSNEGENPVQGSWNSVETDIDLQDGTATFVYDFGTQQANGTIASVCLSNRAAAWAAAEAGVRGTGDCNNTVAYTPGVALSGTIAPAVTVPGSYFSAPGHLLELDESQDCFLLAQVNPDVPSVTLRRYPLKLKEASLFWARGSANLPPCRSENTVSLTPALLSTSTSYLYACFDAERRKLYLISFPTGQVAPNKELLVYEIDVDSFALQSYRITNQTGQTLQSVVSNNGTSTPSANGLIYDGWLYLWGTTKAEDGSKRVFRIRLSDPGEIQEVTTNGLSMPYVHDAHDGRLYYYQYQAGGTDEEPSVVLNTATNEMLTTQYNLTSRYLYNCHAVPIRGRRILLGKSAIPSNTANVKGVTLGLRPTYLATINDLAQPVEKNADMTMKITYTLRRA